MNQTLFDLKAITLSHKGDPDTSKAAAQKMVESGKLKSQGDEILEAIKFYMKYYSHFKQGYRDFTAKELASWVEDNPKYEHLTYHVIQRRKHEIPEIEETDKERNGCKVWRLK